MKTITLTLLLLLATLPGFAEQKELVITFNDGTTQSYALADLPDIRMENDKLSVQAGTTKAEYDLYKVRTFTFGNTASKRLYDGRNSDKKATSWSSPARR